MFRATVVEERIVFWTNLESAPLPDASGATAATVNVQSDEWYILFPTCSVA